VTRGVARGGVRRYGDWPSVGATTWWWWLEFPDRTTTASGAESRRAAIKDARAAARKRGYDLQLSEGERAEVDEDPRGQERDGEHDAAEPPRDEARERARDERAEDG
jgi:hypothetical protein